MMVFKVGNIVSHTGALGWGAGKVLEISANSLTIQFSDGKSRRIASSHYRTLESAPPDSYVSCQDAPLQVVATRARRTTKKK